MNDAAEITAENESVVNIPFNKLIKGSRNVRKVRSGKKADTQLIANIKAKGILQNLVVEPSLTRKGFYGVIAGGRRWSAVRP